MRIFYYFFAFFTMLLIVILSGALPAYVFFSLIFGDFDVFHKLFESSLWIRIPTAILLSCWVFLSFKIATDTANEVLNKMKDN